MLAQRHQLVGDLGTPAGHVEVGEHVRRTQQGLAQRLVGLRRVRHLTAGDGLVAAPHHAGAGAVGHQAEVGARQDDALAGIDHLAGEVTGAREPEQVAGHRKRDARGGGA